VNSEELKKAKRQARREVLAARDALAPDLRADLAQRATTRLLALPEVQAARLVMAFWSFGSELPMLPLIEQVLAGGLSVALPRVVDGDMEARSWSPGEPMTGTPFGAMEPAGGRRVEPEEIDVIATPAVAFDRAGRRVGYGGGFYDRFFPATRADALRAGIGFSLQLVEGDLPAGHFDARLDVVVTDRETVRCPREP
jgi:5-formyltetrahydrofolate cyclo-ligase